jgi:hypothetical protein
MTARTSRVPVSIDARRALQLALAAIWILDGALQLQPFMFTDAFARSFLAISGGGNPTWVLASIHGAWAIVAANPILTNTAFASIQLGLGLAIAWRPMLKLGLALSIVWALVIWWFGEDFGGLLSGGASALTGAPGGALLYALLAVLLWPTGRNAGASFAAARPFGSAVAKAIWLIVWLGLAALNLQPANLQPTSVRSSISGIGDGQPGWLAAIPGDFAHFSGHNGAALSMFGAVILALIGVGILLPTRWARAVVLAAVIASAFIWLVGEALGAPFGGEATDLNTGPLLVFFALAYWPIKRNVA